MLVCLLVPSGGMAAAEAVGTAVRAHHADAELAAVWAGDPQLRPQPPTAAVWIDERLDEPSGVGWHRLLVALTPAAYALSRGVRAAERHLADGGEGVVLLHVGSVAVAGPLDDTVPASGVAAIERIAGAPPADGLAPALGDLVAAGRYATGALAFAAGAADIAGAVAGMLAVSGPRDRLGSVLSAALSMCDVAAMAGGHAVGWGILPAAETPRVVDVEHLDRAEPWRVDFGGNPPRVRLSDDPDLAALLEARRAQWDVDGSTRLAGGVPIDGVMRDLMSRAVEDWRRGEGDLPPEPFGPSGSGFVEWLETPWPPWGPDVGRYWSELRSQRPDLIRAFPHPEGADHEAFAEWARSSWAVDGRSPLLRVSSRPLRPPWHDVSREQGVNLVGYFSFDKSLGDVARRIHASLLAAGVPVAALDYHRSGSPPVADPPELTDRLRYDTNLVVVNADQVPLLDADYGPALRPGRRTIGYWFWDVEHVPASVRDAARLVDEIWVATAFTATSLGAAVDVPVRAVEVPVPEPEPSAATRAELGLPEGRFAFLVTFDHLSVTERKNPIGAIEAFRRAFPTSTDGGPVLVVKSVNAGHRWVEHERVKLATGGRPDITVVDRHLSRGDQLALIGAADCLVSLHRSEGLGLHLMEAMWLGTPVLATRYSGNLHFTDDSDSALVDAAMVAVERGEGYFPPDATWADPDLDQAAAWMRRLVDEPDLGASLASAARARMLAQPSPADTGATIAGLVRAGREGGRGA